MYRPHISPSVSTIPTRKPCQILFAPSTSSAPYTHPNSFWNFQALLANFRHPHRKFPPVKSANPTKRIDPSKWIDPSMFFDRFQFVARTGSAGASRIWQNLKFDFFVSGPKKSHPKIKERKKNFRAPLRRCFRWSYLLIGQYVGPTQPITDVGPRDCSLKPLLWEVSVRTHKTSWQNPRGICGDITYHNACWLFVHTSSLPTSHLKFQVKFVLMSPARSRSSTAWRRPHS